MPLFDFTCTACGHRFDKLFRTMTNKPDAECPKCGSGETKRALSLVNAGQSDATSGEAAPMCGTCGVPGGPCAMN